MLLSNLAYWRHIRSPLLRVSRILRSIEPLSGPVRWLKCCLNYELDIYIEELEKYPSQWRVPGGGGGGGGGGHWGGGGGGGRIKAMEWPWDAGWNYGERGTTGDQARKKSSIWCHRSHRAPMEKKGKRKKKKSPGQGKSTRESGQNIHNRPDLSPWETGITGKTNQQKQAPVSGEGPKEPNDTKPEPPAEITEMVLPSTAMPEKEEEALVQQQEIALLTKWCNRSSTFRQFVVFRSKSYHYTGLQFLKSLITLPFLCFIAQTATNAQVEYQEYNPVVEKWWIPTAR